MLLSYSLLSLVRWDRNVNLEISQILSQVIAFLITVWVLKRFAWKPLLGLMEERQKKIKSEFDEIKNQKEKMRRQAQEYNEKMAQIETQARIRIQEGVQEGLKVAREIQNEAHKQARDILNKAQEEVEREIEKAKVQLKNNLVNIAIAVTQKIIKEKLDSEKDKKLIAEFINDVELNK
jgi:F-type H+-transporting ATPase subunit b